MFKKIFTLSLLSIFLLVSGFGCKNLSQEELVSLKGVKLTYWTVYNDVDMLRSLANEYTARYPHVSINIKQVKYDEFDNLFTNALADDVGPDIVSQHVRWLRKNQSRLLTAPAATKMSRMIIVNDFSQEKQIVTDNNALPNLNYVKNNYVKTVYDDVVFEKSIYGLPVSMDTLAIYYNQDLLDRAGIPEAPKDWNEFISDVKKLTLFNSVGDIVQSGAALGTANNINAASDIIALFIMQSGLKVTSGSNVTFANGVERASDRSAAIFSALDFYTDFARPTKETYSWNEKKADALDEFVRGKVGFYFGYSYDYNTIKKRAPQMNLRIMPILQLNNTSPSNVANYWVESVVQKTKNPNEAWDFVRFVTSPENVAKYNAKVFSPSPIRAQITTQQQDENLAPFATQALFAENWYRGKDIDVVNKTFQNMITEILKPANTESDLFKKDKQIIINSAARIQQTM
ncbi:MAG: extracellular solute-binding protein [Candidatus Magasanikbacteria bacterium]